MARAIDEFTPRSIPANEWAVIAEFTRACVAACEGRTPYHVRRLASITARLTHWCWYAAGIPLETRYVFRHDVIAQFVNGLTDLTTSTRGTYRSYLLRMADVLMEGRQITFRPPGMPPSDPSRPYTAAEQVSLRSWAHGQRTETLRINANLILALGLGAGLSTGEILRLQAQHVEIDDLGVLVRTSGDRPRLVPVLAEWESVVAQVARAAWKPEMYLFTPRRTSLNPNTLHNFVHRSNDRPFDISVQRLRATWIVTHLSAHTPVQALLNAAGIETLKAVGRFLEFVPDIDPTLARRALVRRARAEGCDVTWGDPQRKPTQP